MRASGEGGEIRCSMVQLGSASGSQRVWSNSSGTLGLLVRTMESATTEEHRNLAQNPSGSASVCTCDAWRPCCQICTARSPIRPQKLGPCTLLRISSLHEPVDAAAVRGDDEEVDFALLVLAERQDRLVRVRDRPVGDDALRLRRRTSAPRSSPRRSRRRGSAPRAPAAPCRGRPCPPVIDLPTSWWYSQIGSIRSLLGADALRRRTGGTLSRRFQP